MRLLSLVRSLLRPTAGVRQGAWRWLERVAQRIHPTNQSGNNASVR